MPSRENSNIRHPRSKKLLPKWLGPLWIINQINSVAFKLELPDSMRSIHPVFHISVFYRYIQVQVSFFLLHK